MKTVFTTITLAAFALPLGAPVMAAVPDSTFVSAEDLSGSSVEKRKKKRVKGGSGCDDAGDVIEHPECR